MAEWQGRFRIIALLGGFITILSISVLTVGPKQAFVDFVFGPQLAIVDVEAQYPQPVFFPRRTMWLAGWNAREGRLSTFNTPTLRWNEAAEAVFIDEYNKLQFLMNCTDPNLRFAYHDYYGWGFASVLRDYAAISLASLFARRVLVTQPCMGQPACPEMFFEKQSSCDMTHMGVADGFSMESFSGSTTRTIKLDFHEANAFIYNSHHYWIWQAMNQTGGLTYFDSLTGEPLSHHFVVNTYPDYVLQRLHLSVLRSLLLKTRFHPNKQFQEDIDNQIKSIKNTIKRPTAILHVRRTDKSNDGLNYFNYLRDSVPGGFQSLLPFTEMIARAEQARTPFHSFMLLSDSKQFIEQKPVLQSAFRENASDSSPDLLSKFFLQHKEFDPEIGHVVVPEQLLFEKNRDVLREIFAAIQMGDVILGSGSCGVTQLIALGLGLKFRTDPSSFAIYEEDLLFLLCQKLLNIPGDFIDNFNSSLPVSESICSSTILPRP